MYAIRSKTGGTFRRSGIAFDGKAFRLLSESQVTSAILAEKSLQIVEVTGRDDPKLALHQVLEDAPAPEAQPVEPEDPKPSKAKK